MRTNDDESTPAATYCGENGGYTLVACGACSFVYEDITVHEEPCLCPECEVESFYRSWFSW